MKTQRKGFTLIELLVVIAIIALLLSILTPALVTARELAKQSVCANQIKHAHLALYSYCTYFNGYLPSFNNINGTPDFHLYALWRDDPLYQYPNTHPKAGDPIPLRFGCVYEAGYLDDPKVLYCPSNKSPTYQYESYAKMDPATTCRAFPGSNGQTWPQFYLSTTGNCWVRIGYLYFPTDPKAKKHRDLGYPFQTAKKFDSIDPQTPYLTDNIHSKETISHRIHKMYGVNALFKDGHVVYCDDWEVFNNERWNNWPPPNLNWRIAWEFYYAILCMIEP